MHARLCEKVDIIQISFLLTLVHRTGTGFLFSATYLYKRKLFLFCLMRLKRFFAGIALVLCFALPVSFNWSGKEKSSGHLSAADLPVCTFEITEKAMTALPGQQQPSVKITSPKSGTTVPPEFLLSFEVAHFAVGEDTTHLHWVLQEKAPGGAVLDMQIGIHKKLEPVRFSNLKPGSEYDISLLLMNTSHQSTGVSDRTSIRISKDGVAEQ